MTGAIQRKGLSYADQVEDAIRDQILGGTYAPGDRLNEVELASQLGLSRGPVREAMQRLARDGLVQVEVHRGAFVRQLSADEIRRLFEVRIPLESTAAELAAKRGSPADLRRLEALIESSRAEVQAGDDPHYPTHLDLHELIATLADNDRLHGLILQINRELKLVRGASGFVPVRAPEALDEHVEIVSAIAAHDDRRAGRAMRRHLSRSLTNTLTLVNGN